MKFDCKPLLLVALLAGAGLTTAQAQPADAATQAMAPDSGAAAMPGTVQPQRHHADRRGDAGDKGARMQQRAERMQVRIAQRLAALKVKLKLEQAQEGAWDQFTRALQPTQEQLQRMMSLRSQMRTLSTPERIDRMRALRTERDAAMDQRFDATKAFYAQLSPEQQKTFDQNALPWQRRDSGGRRGGRHHGGGHAGMHHGDGQGRGS